MLRAADTGQSGLIDQQGRWIDSLPFDEVGVLEAEVTPRSGATPYARWGDRIALITCLLCALAFLYKPLPPRSARLFGSIKR
jgi:apolipoprotein N-acyltransferase